MICTLRFIVATLLFTVGVTHLVMVVVHTVRYSYTTVEIQYTHVTHVCDIMGFTIPMPTPMIITADFIIIVIIT